MSQYVVMDAYQRAGGTSIRHIHGVHRSDLVTVRCTMIPLGLGLRPWIHDITTRDLALTAPWILPTLVGWGSWDAVLTRSILMVGYAVSGRVLQWATSVPTTLYGARYQSTV